MKDEEEEALSMWELLESVFRLVKFNPIRRENFVFRISNYVTSILLLVFCAIWTARSYVGEAIECTKVHLKLFGTNNVHEFELYVKAFHKVIESFCLVEGVFSISNKKGIMGKEMVYPGVADIKSGDQIRRFEFYQFVGFFLLFQAACFNVAPSFWKSRENGLMKKMVLPFKNPIEVGKMMAVRQHVAIEHFVKNMKDKNSYAYSYFFCELLNFLNVLAQIYLTNLFIGGGFYTYGTDVFFPGKNEPDPRDNAMTHLFPTLAKCSFYKFGHSGTLTTIDVSCLLPLNATIRRIFLILWFWYFILMVLFGVNLLYRIVVVLSSWARFKRFEMCAKSCSDKKMKIIFKSCGIGDWFFLCQFRKNLDLPSYKRFLENLFKQLTEIQSSTDNLD